MSGTLQMLNKLQLLNCRKKKLRLSILHKMNLRSFVTVLAKEFHEIIHIKFHTMPGTWKMFDK